MAEFIERALGRGLHLAHQNCRSLPNKFDTIRAQLLGDKFSVLTLSETWFTPNHRSNLYDVPGYSLFRNDRVVTTDRGKLKRGGGVAMYISDSISVDNNELDQYNASNKDIEILWITIKHNFQRDIAVATVYRPPNGDLNEFVNMLTDSLLAMSNHSVKKEIFILGDMNVDMLTYDNDRMKIKDLCDDFGMVQLITEPTRWGRKKNLLDLILTSSDRIKVSNTLQWGISDHELVYVTRKLVNEKFKRTKKTGRRYKNYSKLAFTDRLKIENWDEIDLDHSVGAKWDSILLKMENALSIDCPIVTFTVRDRQDPWITNEILELISNKFKLGKNARGGSQEDVELYKQANRICVREVRKAKGHFIRRTHHEVGNDCNKFWRNLRWLLPSGKHSDKIEICQTIRGVTAKLDDTTAASELNYFFSNIGRNLASGYTREWHPPNPPTQSTLPELHITTGYFKSICKEINVAKPSGIKNISATVVRDAFLAIPHIITKLFNQAIVLSDFPDRWKSAVVVPLHKGGKRSEYSNYRPISILPLPGKLLERCYHHHITYYLESHGLLIENQSGFRRGHSTSTAVCKLTNDIFDSMNNKRMSVVSFIDLTKAFDTVNHNILLKKLDHLGIKGNLNKCIKNYLTNREQCTRVGESMSEPLTVSCGVPQGSVLGPLLFLIYINDITEYISSKDIELFADDAAIKTMGKSEANVGQQHQAKLDALSEWCSLNRLTINVNKTKTMVFGMRGVLSKLGNKNYLINGIEVENVDKFKYLGIILDPTLNFCKHLDKTIATVAHKVWELGTIRKYSTIQMSLTTYKSTILPYFDYCDIVYTGGQKKQLTKLQRLQNRALKICLIKPQRFSTEDIHRISNTPKLEMRRIAHLNNYAFKLALDPTNIKVKARETRSSSSKTLITGIVKCAAYQRSCYYMAACSWNNLSHKQRSITSLSLFKKKEKEKMKNGLK